MTFEASFDITPVLALFFSCALQQAINKMLLTPSEPISEICQGLNGCAMEKQESHKVEIDIKLSKDKRSRSKKEKLLDLFFPNDE